METWEEARINRLEDRVDRIERKELERRDFILRLVMHGLTAIMVAVSIASIVLSIARAAH
jgi:hypothetical protein